MSFMKKQGEAAGMTDAKAKARHSWTPKHAKKRYLKMPTSTWYLSCLGRIRIVMCGIWMTGAKLEKATYEIKLSCSWSGQ